MFVTILNIQRNSWTRRVTYDVSFIAQWLQNVILAKTVAKSRSRQYNDFIATLTSVLFCNEKIFPSHSNSNTSSIVVIAVAVVVPVMPLVLISPDDMLLYGLIAVKVDAATQGRRCQASNAVQFKAIFGRHPKHLARIWRDLQVRGLLDVQELGFDLSFRGFLLANNRLKTYSTLHVQGALFSMPKNLMGELRWSFIRKIAGLKQHKICLPTAEEFAEVKMCLSVDGTHEKTNEPRDDEMRRNPKNFSFKHNYSGLNYQVAIHLFEERICYANTGDPGSVHDMTAMRNEFIGLLPVGIGVRVVADAGYSGKSKAEKRIFAVSNPFDTRRVKELKNRGRSRQETVNERVKEYKAMKDTWTDGIAKHHEAFAACLVMVQYSIEDTSETGEPLLTV